MQILDAVNPPADLLWLLVSVLNALHIHWCCPYDVSLLDISKFDNCLVFVIKRWFIKHCDTKIFFGIVWLWHLHEGVHFSNAWYVVWDEWL